MCILVQILIVSFLDQISRNGIHGSKGRNIYSVTLRISGQAAFCKDTAQPTVLHLNTTVAGTQGRWKWHRSESRKTGSTAEREPVTSPRSNSPFGCLLL